MWNKLDLWSVIGLGIMRIPSQRAGTYQQMAINPWNDYHVGESGNRWGTNRDQIQSLVYKCPTEPVGIGANPSTE